MAYRIVHLGSLKDLKNIDKKQSLKIIEKIDTELLNNPGKDKPLTGKKYKGLFSYRVGDYRVIYTIKYNADFLDDNIILILRIGHRREIYKDI